MNGIRFLIALVFVPVLGLSQTQHESMVVSSGSAICNQEGSLDWVVGEGLIDLHLLFGDGEQGDPGIQQRSHSFLVYPSVTSGDIRIFSDEAEPTRLSVHVHNMAEMVVLSRNWIKNPMELNLSKLPSGVYIIRLANQEKLVVATFKIIKK
jgi:hypothetical protein